MRVTTITEDVEIRQKKDSGLLYMSDVDNRVFYLLVKKSIDKLGALAGLFVLSPVFIIIAKSSEFVKLDSPNSSSFS